MKMQFEKIKYLVRKSNESKTNALNAGDKKYGVDLESPFDEVGRETTFYYQMPLRSFIISRANRCALDETGHSPKCGASFVLVKICDLVNVQVAY
ncbi:hypothetical protein AVEN_64071-1 [Araneus ventricosus]|uniref:Uncharacterized protein n=1 Tax=Araneus ventricosus TaxID=182803 RepID=A0A4Y2STP2_ARAVE|nr:hypothetical protein AVEN_64071-1 [Araneus ventricosus]